MQYVFLLSALPMGLMMTVCTLVGSQIAEGNVAGARLYYKSVNQFSAIFWVAMLCLVGFLNKYMFEVFTDEKELLVMRDELFPFVLFVLGLDFWQVILGGTLRALAL